MSLKGMTIYPISLGQSQFMPFVPASCSVSISFFSQTCPVWTVNHGHPKHDLGCKLLAGATSVGKE